MKRVNISNEKLLSSILEMHFPKAVRRISAWVGRIYSTLIVTNKNISEDNGFNLPNRKQSCIDLVEFFYFQGSEKASHSSIIITSASSAHALMSLVFAKNITKILACKLTSPVRVKNHRSGASVAASTFKSLYA